MEISQITNLMASKVTTQLDVNLLKTTENLQRTVLELIPSAVGNNVDTRA